MTTRARTERRFRLYSFREVADGTMDREEAVIARREGRRYSTEDREADEFIAALTQEQGR